MSKVAIIYHSEHHGNTEKLLMAVEEKYSVDMFSIPTTEKIDLSGYETIGFASGIFMSQLHQSLFDFINSCSDNCESKKAFIIFTSGTDKAKYADSLLGLLTKKGFDIIGTYHCLGYDTYGPWKFIGGIAKGHPDKEDIEKFISFYQQTIASEK